MSLELEEKLFAAEEFWLFHDFKLLGFIAIIFYSITNSTVYQYNKKHLMPERGTEVL